MKKFLVRMLAVLFCVIVAVPQVVRAEETTVGKAAEETPITNEEINDLQYEEVELTPLESGVDYPTAMYNWATTNYMGCTRQDFINGGFGNVPEAWCVWFINQLAKDVGAGSVFCDVNVTTTFFEKMTDPNGPYRAQGFKTQHAGNYSCFQYAQSVSTSTFVPQKGDILCIKDSNHPQIAHVTFVYDFDGTFVYFIDGNGGTAKPTKVRAHKYNKNVNESWGAIVGYIRPNYAALDRIQLNGISLNTTQLTMQIGEQSALTVNYNPSNTTDSKAVTWSSSNTNVATVSNGTVTANGAGNAVITATCNGKTAACNVTVRSKETPVVPDTPEVNTNVTAFVDRLYSLVLNRDADSAGLNSWTNALVSRTSSGIDIGYGFVFSSECINRNISNDAFVEMLYQTFMNRSSDAGGKAAWVSQLDAGVGREKVFGGFVMSAEFANICSQYNINVGTKDSVGAFAAALNQYRNRNANVTKFVARCYTEALGRGYETGGLEDWCRVILQRSNTPKQVAQNFIFSAEFAQKGLSDEEYVKVLYRTFMGREADAGGLAAWVEVLKSGRENREKVLEGFSDSVEFDGILQSFGLN